MEHGISFSSVFVSPLFLLPQGTNYVFHNVVLPTRVYLKGTIKIEMKKRNEKWFIDKKHRNKKVSISSNAIQNGQRNNNKIGYTFKTHDIEIEMQHYIRANVFTLRKDGRISGINSNRGYSIIRKWHDNPHALSIRGDVRDIAIDNIFACGGRIVL